MLLKRLKNDGISRLELNELQNTIKEQIVSKIDNEEYQFESIICPICDFDGKELIGEKDRYGFYFSTNICKQCGFVYTSPRMNQESYDSFYNLEYRKLYSGSEQVNPNFFEFQRKFGKRIYKFLDKNNLIKKKQMFVLEVGCGAGGIIDYFREEGHTVKGIDLGEQYVNYGKENYGLDLEVSTLKELSLKDKPDLIIYSHVLEHILDINKEVNLIQNFITKDTIIYIEVPGIKEIHNNYNSDILKYFQNAHTFHFTLESLSNLMNKHQFVLISGNQFVMSAFKLGNTSIKYVNDYEPTKRYLHAIEFKRKKKEMLERIKNKLKIFLFKVLKFTNTYNVVRNLYRKGVFK
jgi:2-polyprenyl-3-methyl-5-hydroxy-6-metoxy-1,4-benzoquinol methylase